MATDQQTGKREVLQRSAGDMTGTEILEWVGEQGPESVADLMSASGTSRSPCAHILRDMWTRGLLVRAWGVRQQPCRVYATPETASDDREWAHADGDPDPDEMPVWRRAQMDA